MFEETGLKIFSPKLCEIKDWSNDDGSRYMVLFYKTDKFEGTLSSSEKGEVHWIELDEMKKMNLADRMDKVLEVFWMRVKANIFSIKKMENGKKN